MLKTLESWLWYAFVFTVPFQVVWILREPMIAGEKWQYGTWGVYASDVVLIVLLAVLVWRWRKRVRHTIRHCEGVVPRGLSSVFSGSTTKQSLICIYTSELSADKKIIILGGSFLLISFLSTFWALDSSTALQTTIRYALGIGAFFAACYAKYSLRITIFVFIAAMGMHAIIGMGQFFAQYSPPVTVLGMAEYDPWKPGVSVLKLEGERWLRSYGGFPHPNIFGGALVIALFGAMGLWFQEGRRTLKRALFIVGSILAVALLFTFSRTAWAGLMLGGIVIMGLQLFYNAINSPSVLRTSPPQLRGRRAKSPSENSDSACNFQVSPANCRKSQQISRYFYSIFAIFGRNLKNFGPKASSRTDSTFAGVIFVLFACVVFLIALLFPLLLSRFDSEIISREASVSERVIFMDQAWQAIGEHPFLGVGAGNFTAWTSQKNWSEGSYIAQFQPVHNVLLLLVAELGLVGFALLAFTVLSFVWRMKKENRLVFFALVAILFPALAFDHWLLTSHVGVMIVGILMGMVCRDTFRL